jgi:hypothetical protein
MRLRRLAVLAGMCGTVALAAVLAATGPAELGVPHTEMAVTPPIASGPPKPAAAAPTESDSTQVAKSAPELAPADAAIPEKTSAGAAALPLPMPETPSVKLASINPADALPDTAKKAPSSGVTADACVSDACIDEYLWSVYQRTPKEDTVTVSEQVKVTVTKKGKTQTVTKNVAKLVDEDFGWKDPKAAEKAGMSLKDYVIGGMDRSFKVKLYRALRAMDEAGLEPGITSAFRDDYRQSLASGKKAADNRSYHGGSLRGGYGHGLAADLASVKGATRAERFISSEALWKWIDAHGADYGVARIYLDRDPPHVGPIDGQEYADKRGRGTAKQARAELSRRHEPAASNDHPKTKSAKTAPPKARSS